ncbi:hypothetical protein [Acidovorax sp. 100]|uniref:hypothetical protein n=1 Tax=Acidovorax sp. 100 TaxID=2135635 RepID=UPI0013141C42|nr:hypothetical protein [Acidovorax sp. 100]
MMSGTNVSRGRLMLAAPYAVRPFTHNAPATALGEGRKKQKQKSHLAAACSVNTKGGVVAKFLWI